MKTCADTEQSYVNQQTPVSVQSPRRCSTMQQRGHIQHVTCLGMEQRDMVTQEMGGNGKAQGRI